ncbi:MAG: hypothetical protein NVS9B5_26250 [Terriglobales bacterium]
MKLTVISKRGKEATLAILGAGDFLGESGISSHPPLQTATATALTDTSILKVDRKQLLRTLNREPAMAELFVSHLISRMMRIQEDLIDQLFNSSGKRLARILLLLAHFGKESRSEKVFPKISQEALAEMVGTTRPRINFFLNRFRKLGFIKYNGEIEVNSTLMSVLLGD